MPRSSPIQTSFNAGKWGPLLQGRVDLEKYTSACNELKNFIPTVQGPALKRSGTRFLKTVKNQAKKSRLIPFEFSTEQAYVLELYEGGMRVLKDSGAVLEPTVAITAIVNGSQNGLLAVQTYTTGDEVYITGTAQSEMNGRFFTVTGSSSTAFLINENGIGRATGGGGTAARVYSISNGVLGNALPWLEAELESISFVQNGDILFLAHPNHPPHKITRTAHTSWTSEKIEWKWPAFRPENSDDETFLQCEENTGTSKQLRVRSYGVERRSSGASLWVPKLTCASSNAAPVVITTASNHGYSNGDAVWLWDLSGGAGTALNDNHYTISNVTANTFTLDGTSAPGATGSTGGVEKITTNFRFTSGMQGSYFKLRELPGNHMPEWSSNATWNTRWNLYDQTPNWIGRVVHNNGIVYASYSQMSNMGLDPPTGELPTDQIPNVGGANDGGMSFYNRAEGYGEVKSVDADGLTCTIDIERDLPYSVSDVNPCEASSGVGEGWRGHGTQRWAEGAWSQENGYPRAVAFYEDRLWFAGTEADPQTFWGSRTGEYEDFEGIADRADSSVTFTLASEDINAIEWLAGDQQLLIGTRGGEFIASGTRETEAITASNITVRRQSKYGVKPGVQPRFVDSALLFVQRAGERLHQLSYSNDSNRYVGPDVTALSNDILRPSAAELAYQSSPFRQLWVRLTDGNLATLTYVSDQDVLGWAEIEIGGVDVEVESLAVIPHPDGDQDQVWMIVKRKIGGATKRYIEYLEKPFSAVSSNFTQTTRDITAGINVYYDVPSNTGSSLVGVICAVDDLPAVGDVVSINGLTPGVVGGIEFSNLNGNSYTVVSAVGQVFRIDVSPELSTIGGRWVGPDGTFTSVRPPDINYEDAFFVDSGLTYSGSPTTTITGLDHLEGQVVKVFADGLVQDEMIVFGGAISITSASKVQVGLGYNARLQTMRLESGAADGTAQGRRKRVQQILLRVDNSSQSVSYGANFDKMDSWDMGDQGTYSGDSPSFTMPGGYEREGRISIRHQDPTPFTLVAIMPQLSTESR